MHTRKTLEASRAYKVRLYGPASRDDIEKIQRIRSFSPQEPRDLPPGSLTDEEFNEKVRSKLIEP